jgi:glutaredoxin
VLVSQVSTALARGMVDRETSASRKLLVLGGFLASGVRLATATSIGRLGPRPQQLLELWDNERSAQARSVREALSILDLDALVHPSTALREPRLKDPNAGAAELVGAQPIVRHVYEKYGARPPPRLLHASPVRAVTGAVMGLLTGRASPRPVPAPPKPLELWSFESSPYCRLVRTLLTGLELPYLLHNVAKDSPKREAFIARSGKMQVPYLLDPNTGTEMFESVRIEQYLLAKYAV